MEVLGTIRFRVPQGLSNVGLRLEGVGDYRVQSFRDYGGLGIVGFRVKGTGDYGRGF